jgi:hypothetical protein
MCSKHKPAYGNISRLFSSEVNMGNRSIWSKMLFVCLLFGSFSSLQVYAEDQTVAVVDGVMDDIAARIATNRYRYLVFSNFDVNAMSRSADGFKELRYAYPLAEGRNLEVNVLVLSLDAKIDEEMAQWQHMDFPLLKIKVLWATVRAGFYLDGFDLNSIVEDAIWPLIDFQQKQLPFKMSIETAKTAYQVGEPVNLDLVVKNVSGKTLRVKPLDYQNAYCAMNDQAWGTKDFKPAPSRAVLRAGEEMRFLLKLKGITAPGDFKIICSYGIGNQGVRPQARKILKIEGNPIKDN